MLPCNDCLKVVASYGIKKIVYAADYERDLTSLELAKLFGIELEKIEWH
jgi:deoxycytidylate deaminase